MDTIFLNGNIITMEDEAPRAEAVAVRDGRIAWVGRSDEARNLVESKTRVIDLQGKTLIPGFIDAHNHMLMFGKNLLNIDLQDPSIRQMDDILALVAGRAGKYPAGKWIEGWGYDDTKLREKRHPDRRDLDRAAPDHPVFLMRTDGHTAAVNSRALQLAGITRTTPDPEGGEIDREPGTGEPTGILRETAKKIVMDIIPPGTREELSRVLGAASRRYVREGITSVGEAGVGFMIEGPLEMQAWQAARDSGELHVRAYLMILTMPDTWYATGIKTGLGDEMLRIGPRKMFLDGGIGGRTAAMKAPYIGEPAVSGIIYTDEDTLASNIEKAHVNGWQVACHAIGDRAVETLVNAYERVLAKHPREGHRHRIEHCGILDRAMIQRIKRLGIIPVPQANFFYYLGDSFLANLGEERIRWTYPLKSFLDAGLPAALSSDRPVCPGRPLGGVQSAVIRRTTGGTIIAPEERVSAYEALKMYTINAAHASFEEKIKGSIRSGKLADLVVLDRDPLEVPTDEIASLEVRMTMVGGRVVCE